MSSSASFSQVNLETEFCIAKTTSKIKIAVRATETFKKQEQSHKCLCVIDLMICILGHMYNCCLIKSGVNSSDTLYINFIKKHICEAVTVGTVVLKEGVCKMSKICLHPSVVAFQNAPFFVSYPPNTFVSNH